MKKRPYSPQLHDFYANQAVQLRARLAAAGDLAALLAVSGEALRLARACPYLDVSRLFHSLMDAAQAKIDEKYSIWPD